MTCHDARERLSDLLDDALEARDASVVGAHLAECAECRRELERLRATVGLLQRVEPPRAPIGFVERVVERAYPRAWYRRLAAWLFLPLSVKLPVEAAALVMVAGLAMFLWERTPELRDAARMERSAPASSSSRPSQPSPPTPPAASQPSPAPPVPLRAPVPQPPPAAPAETRETPPPPRAAFDPSVAERSEAKRQDTSEPDRARAATRSSPSIVGSPAASMPQSRPAAVMGRLMVSDRTAVDRSVADLISRVGGRETGRRQDGATTVLELLIPAPRYEEFVSGLQALGSWSAEGQPIPMPTDPPQIRLTIHIQ